MVGFYFNMQGERDFKMKKDIKLSDKTQVTFGTRLNCFIALTTVKLLFKHK